MGLKKNNDLPPIDKPPFEKLDRQKALQFKDSIFLYNPFTNCESVYSVYESGFLYTVTKVTAPQLLLRANNVWAQKRSREVDEDEFKEFIKKVEALQEQTHILKPISPFEDFVKTIIEKHGLKVK